MRRSSTFSRWCKSTAAFAAILALTATAAFAQDESADRGGESVLQVDDVRALARQLGVSLDDTRPDQQFETNVFGRPLIIGGELEFAGQWRDNLDPAGEDGVGKLTPEAQLEFLYLFSDRLIAFAEIKAFADAEVWTESGDGESDVGLDLREAWMLAPRIFGSDFSLQVGRQQYQDRREWWWNENLDSVRLHYVNGRFTAFVGAAESVMRTSTLEDIDPEEEDVFRVLGNAAFTWSKHDRIEAFLQAQNDNSGAPALGAALDEDDADEADSDLTWWGLRARTRQSIGDAGKVFLSADFAMVDGDETVTEFADAAPGQVRAVDRFTQDVSGWGADVSVSWELPIDLEPVLSASIAYGSGDDTPADASDDSFRQTGLQGDNGKFRGISRFRYYGETMRPELSNLIVTTLSLGSPVPAPAQGEAWIEAIYHNYRQAEAASDFRSERLDVDPNGLSENLGDAVDIVYAYESGQRWEFEATLGGFRYGEAFGANEGEWASSVSFKLDYNF
jgi:alginate production protein